MIDFLLPIGIAFAVFVWLRTNAFVDYLAWLLVPRNLLYVRDYLNDGLSGAMEYPLWLSVKHTGFFVKLISCPLCCTFWLNFLIAPLPLLFFNSYISILAFVFLDRAYKK
jgi:hypothetical protein